MDSERVIMSALNMRRVAFAYRTGLPADRVELAWWCDQGHDPVTWMACPGDSPACWLCGRPPQLR